MPTDKPTLVNRGIYRGISEIDKEAREMSRGQKYDVSSTIKSCDVLVPSKNKYNSNAITNIVGS